ncbi:hypothetical protein [Nocardioides sp. Soil805]|uniref:hypothetical protein n=1 Tax=Nocardioides sp. Soil805 TaxID=1736416 RepID=UPI0007036A63|nr:hypothetical protein [Nocardioides sp. Soil805]KRF36380.1 hypothetical protein ASG94_02660 [Nocardioides sp. Soil805]
MTLRLRTIRTAVAIGTAGALLAAAPAGAAVPTTDLDPADLSRGPDIAIPHLDGTTFVDGDRRVAIDAERVTLLGRSGRAFILGTSGEDGLGPHRVVRLRPDDSVTPLLKASPWSITVSEDGRRLVRLRNGNRRSSPVSVHSARSGRLVAKRGFPDYPNILGMDGRRVLMSTWERGTFWWDLRTGRTPLVTTRVGGVADVGHDLLSTYTADPYLDGCTVLSRLSRPGRTLWTSCHERVESVNPDGTGIATVHILSDGVGPGRVSVRTVRGTLLARYDAGQWFGAIGWEDADTVLLDTNGTQYATVRCRLTECENATDPEPALELRPVG